jgi:oxygen-dependent protoporphyrinogen oxidase
LKIVVVGGGLAGLFTASELIATGIDDVLVADRVTRTVERHGFSLEPAAGSFSLPHPHLSPILRRADVAVIESTAASRRYVFSSGRLIEIASSPKAILAPLLPADAKLRALGEPLVNRSHRDTDETLASFLRRRFGQRAGHLLGWLMASGVYAGDPDELSASSAFPGLTSLEEQAGSVVRGGVRAWRRRPDGVPPPRPHTPVGGMSTLAGAISESLGDRYRPSFPVTAVRPGSSGWVVAGPDEIEADVVVLATHPQQAAGLVDAELASHLGRSLSAPVVTIGLGGRGESPLPSGFGALVTPDNAMVSRGLLFESSYAPERAPDGAWLLKVVAGGALSPDLVDWDDDRLIAVVTAESERVLASGLSPQFTEVVRHRPGIPQYVLGHGSWLEDLEGLLAARPGLHVTGWGYRGVGVAHQATDAVRTAKLIRG